MKRTRNICRLAGLLLALPVFLTACGGQEAAGGAAYRLPEQPASVANGVVAQNERFRLYWDSMEACLIVEDLATGEIRSSMPYEYYMGEERGGRYIMNGLGSSLQLEYVNSENLEQGLASYEDASAVEAEQIRDGIRLTYYFDEVHISVPVEYTLNADGLTAAVQVEDIAEQEYKLYTVSLLPFFAAVKNDTGSRLFVPSGSGAWMDTDSGQRDVRTYQEAVYGGDAAVQEMYRTTYTQAVRMPVFGTVEPDGTAVLGVIDRGAELASVCATAGDTQYGYSSVYAQFRLRGKATAVVKDVNNLNASVNKYTDGLVNVSAVSVRYILTSYEDSALMGLVGAYRQYLSESEELPKAESGPAAVLNFLGGVQEQRLLLGIPYHTTAVTTTLQQVQGILGALREVTGATLAVNLKGFGESGIDAARLADSFRRDGRYGSQDEWDALRNWCGANHVDLYMDFDVIRYTQSGNGYSTREAARTANQTLARVYPYDLVTHAQDTAAGGSYLLGRYHLARIGGRLSQAAADNGLTGIGLSTLSSWCYSDAGDALYYNGAHMQDDVVRAMETLEQANVRVMSESANLYAALHSSCINNTPSSSSGYSYFDEEVPFYQLVLSGIVPMSGATINLASDPETEFLNSLSTGCALSFTLTGQTAPDSVREAHPELGLSVYGGLSRQLLSMLEQASPLLEKTQGQPITEYVRDGEVAMTRFQNGVTVWVNFGETAADSPLGSIPARSFLYQ